MGDDLILYILMRTDLASLNPGKACAQASHAANQCVAWGTHETVAQDLGAWADARGFGTCVVLGAPDVDAMRATVVAAAAAGHHAGVTHDPEYPLRDGVFTHLIPLDTCAFIFGRRDRLAPFVSHLSLMP